jgi:4-amino-4-deoxy-L-arabinose transferase-like glycosyltransferase
MRSDLTRSEATRSWIVPTAAGLIALVAFGYGFGIHTLRFGDQGFAGDSLEYFRWAGNLCFEGIFSGDPDSPPAPSAFRAPLFPALLSVVMMATGLEGFFVAARHLQLVIFALSAAVVFGLTHSLFGLRPAVFAGLGFALYFPLVYSSTQLTTENLAVLLLAASLLALHRGAKRTNPFLLVASGVLLGLGILTRPNLLFVLPAMLVWVAVETSDHPMKRRALWMGLLVAGTSLPVAPWTARNAAVMGGFCLVSTNGGMNFYLGQAPDFDPLLGAPTTEYGVFNRLRQEGLSEIEADRRLYRMGLARMANAPAESIGRTWTKMRVMMNDFADFLHPWRFWGLVIIACGLALRRHRALAGVASVAAASLVGWSWLRGELPGDGLMVAATSWSLVWPLMLVGLALSRPKWRVTGLLMVVWASILAAGAVFIPLVRIRWTADFIAIIIAAYGLNALMSRLQPSARISASSTTSTDS